MTTVMVSGRGGSRRCDQTCHEAKPGSTCGCVCGGKHHGAGERVIPNLARDLEHGTLTNPVRAAVLAAARRDRKFGTALRRAREAVRAEEGQAA